MKCAIYTRVSTEDQVKEGYSLSAQLERLTAYAASQNWEIHDVYTDEGVSAKNTLRPEFQRLLMDGKNKKFEVLLVYKLDRLTRNVKDLYEILQVLDKHGIGFTSATEVFDTTNAMGRLFVTIVAAMAQWERENLAERIKMGFDQKKREGIWHSTKIPYGFIKDGNNLVPHPEQALVMQELFRKYMSGQGVHRLNLWLNEQTGIAWTHSGTYYTLTNPTYAGLLSIGPRNSNPELIPATNIIPIISAETWHQSRQVASRRAGLPPRTGTGQYALVGVLRCGICGGAVVGYTTRKTRKTKPMYIYYGYKCLHAMRKSCSNKMFKLEPLEIKIINQLEQVAQNALKSASVEPMSKHQLNTRDMLTEKLCKLKDKRKRWMDAYEAESIDVDSLRERLISLSNAEEKIKHELSQLKESAIDESLYSTIALHLRTAWTLGTLEERRELIRSVVDKIYLYPNDSIKITLANAFEDM